MPSVYWSKHSFPDHAGVVYCTAVLTSTAEVLSEKVVMFSESQSATCFKVLARGVLIKEGAVQSKTEAEDVLRKTASMQLCAGAVRHEDYDEALFTTKLTDHVLTRQGLYFSRNFLGHVPKQGMPCVSCLYLRRALLTRRSRAQHKITKARHNIAQRLKTAPTRNKTKDMDSTSERANWSEDETITLITLWEEKLAGLRGQKRNGKIYASITAALATYGIIRTRAQVHSKIENLRSKYRAFSKKRTTGSGAVPWPFYWRIHKFLGSLPGNDPTLAVESGCGDLSVSQLIRSMETGEDLEDVLENEPALSSTLNTVDTELLVVAPL
ncbi:hypothetical protein HPB49_014200 [Dermacentor silvarum]|uniref:Uncharacterized protein n=1 Tax=Dermacentor silvarum TaxID=543639 RepID=A0ACB8C422_DERSI|nr:hypothetical protein HPB49_014200 [Dermacentor silvarum]